MTHVIVIGRAFAPDVSVPRKSGADAGEEGSLGNAAHTTHTHTHTQTHTPLSLVSLCAISDDNCICLCAVGSLCNKHHSRKGTRFFTGTIILHKTNFGIQSGWFPFGTDLNCISSLTHEVVLVLAKRDQPEFVNHADGEVEEFSCVEDGQGSSRVFTLEPGVGLVQLVVVEPDTRSKGRAASRMRRYRSTHLSCQNKFVFDVAVWFI